jgi:hypothetical protein
MQGNTGQNIVNFNIKRFISKIIDLKSDSITGVYQKSKKINGAVWRDYIIIKQLVNDELPTEDTTIKQPINEVKEELPVKEVKEVKEDLPAEDKAIKPPKEELTIEDIANACKVLVNKNKEDLKAELNLDDDKFNETKNSLLAMQTYMNSGNIKAYNESNPLAEIKLIKKICRC